MPLFSQSHHRYLGGALDKSATQDRDYAASPDSRAAPSRLAAHQAPHANQEPHNGFAFSPLHRVPREGARRLVKWQPGGVPLQVSGLALLWQLQCARHPVPGGGRAIPKASGGPVATRRGLATETAGAKTRM